MYREEPKRARNSNLSYFPMPFLVLLDRSFVFYILLLLAYQFNALILHA